MNLLPKSPFCYLVAGRENCLHYSLPNTLEKAIRGGVSMVQLREKNASTEERIRLGKMLLPIVNQYGIPLIINDDLDAAEALQVGVHLGQGDAPCGEARKRLGNKLIIGLSLDDPEQVTSIPPEADYLGVGPIFHTCSKLNAATPWGLEALRTIREKIKRPLVAIGGINDKNIFEVAATGVDGVAVISHITQALDPYLATQELSHALKWKTS